MQIFTSLGLWAALILLNTSHILASQSAEEQPFEISYNSSKYSHWLEEFWTISGNITEKTLSDLLKAGKNLDERTGSYDSKKTKYLTLAENGEYTGKLLLPARYEHAPEEALKIDKVEKKLANKGLWVYEILFTKGLGGASHEKHQLILSLQKKEAPSPSVKRSLSTTDLARKNIRGVSSPLLFEKTDSAPSKIKMSPLNELKRQLSSPQLPKITSAAPLASESGTLPLDKAKRPTVSDEFKVLVERNKTTTVLLPSQIPKLKEIKKP